MSTRSLAPTDRTDLTDSTLERATPVAFQPWRPAPTGRLKTARPLHVAIVSESFVPQVNGVTNSVLRVLEHLGHERHRATVVAPSGPDSWEGTPVVRTAAVTMPQYPDFPVGMATRSRLRRLFELDRPDVVHLASPALLGLAAAQAARDLGIPTVAVYQTDLIGFAAQYPIPGGARVMRRLVTAIHRQAEVNLVPSRASWEQLSALGVPRLRTWPRGVDQSLFHPDRRRSALRNRLGVDRHEIIVGYVGRLAAEKELHLLAALHHLPGIRLVMVGGGPEQEHLQRLLPKADFLGVLRGEQLAETVASFDIFVHTGSTETFCQAAQEALASGVPVVGPDGGGIRDLVQPGVNGLLFAPGDAQDLFVTIDVLVGDPTLRRQFGNAAVAGVRARTWDAVNQTLIAAYVEAIGRAGTRPDVVPTGLRAVRDLHDPPSEPTAVAG